MLGASIVVGALKMKGYLCLCVVLIFLVAACGPTSTEVALQAEVTLPSSTQILTATQQPPTMTLTKTPQPTATATPTKTPRPTATKTVTPSPTPTSIVLPTKQILMQFGVFGGDGGSPSDFYFGRDTPIWVLYIDGQLLVQKSDENGAWFVETTLTVPQMCSLLSRFQRTGFFQIQGDGSLDTNDPIYKFDSTAQFSDGAPVYFVQVNGQPHKQLIIYVRYVPYLIPEAKAAFDLVSNFNVPGKLSPYQPQYAMLWIEKGRGESVYATPAPTPQAWPIDIPSLENLAEQNIQTSVYVDESYGIQVSQVLIEGKDVQFILRLFENHLAGKLFKTGNGEYFVIARPLLPHEAPNSISDSYSGGEFEMPFRCSN